MSILRSSIHRDLHSFPTRRSSDLRIFLMSRKIILIKQELLLLVYELNRSGLLAENEKIRPILAPLPALTVKLSKYNVDDVALGVCKTGAEEAGVTEVRTSLSEKKFELWREIKV